MLLACLLKILCAKVDAGSTQKILFCGWLVGNPVSTSSIVEDCSKAMVRLRSAYIAKGDSAVTPGELLKIRGKLLSSNSIYVDEIRWDEVSSLRFEDVVADVTSVHSNWMIEGIAFTVQGKSDIHPVTLMIWYDHAFPHLCSALIEKHGKDYEGYWYNDRRRP
jgi:hypothetical protein